MRRASPQKKNVKARLKTAVQMSSIRFEVMQSRHL
jgi:hypothetical protein